MAVGEEAARAKLSIRAHVGNWKKMTPECCTHCGSGFVVSLTGGRGENILTSLEVGGGGAGAMSEARSLRGRAGGGRPGGGGEE